MFVFEMIESALNSKNANEGVKVETREVSEEYVKSQVAKYGEEVIKK